MCKERKEPLTHNSIAFFDADKTLWKVIPEHEGDDWASKGAEKGLTRTFTLIKPDVVVRTEDNTQFILKEEVKETLLKLSREGIGIGLISDNLHIDVLAICELFNIWDYFNAELVNVKLWDGPCPKDQMITEVFGNNATVNPAKVVLVDDRNYSEEMTKLGYSFILSPKDTFPKEEIIEMLLK